MRLLFAIAAGGALGSVARYLVGAGFARWLGEGFPWGTLAVNVIGGLVMGAVVGALPREAAPELRAFLAVGVLGGFTTFSAFAFDAVSLLERGQTALAALYIGASVLLAILALALGMAAVRWLSA